MTASDGALAALLRRDRAIVIGALVVLTGASWTYILSVAASMNAPPTDMSPMGMSDMAAMMAPRLMPWTLTHAGFVFVMWAVMMVGDDDAVSSPDGPYLYCGGPPSWIEGTAVCGGRLVRMRLPVGLDNVRFGRHGGSMDAGAARSPHPDDGERKRKVWRGARLSPSAFINGHRLRTCAWNIVGRRCRLCSSMEDLRRAQSVR